MNLRQSLNRAARSGIERIRNTMGPRPGGKRQKSGKSRLYETAIGMHGGFGQIAQVAMMGARVTRGIIDMHDAMAAYTDEEIIEQAFPPLANLRANGMVLAVCLRYTDPVDEHYDTWPAADSADGLRFLGIIQDLVTLPEAVIMGNQIWVQVNNEIQAGPGEVPSTNKANFLAMCSATISTIRAANSHIKIVSPAVTLTPMLITPDADLNATQVYRKNLMIDACALDWDYIDLHLHEDGADSAQIDIVNTINSVLDDRELCCLEWSMADYYANGGLNEDEAMQAGRDIWRTMNEYKLLCGCYGPFVSGPSQPSQFQQIALTSYTDGSPRQPYYEFYKECARKVERTFI